MIMLLSDFPDVTLSKMFVKQLQELINSELNSVFGFLNQKIFQPPQMRNTVLLIPWDSNKDELIFASQTSIVSYQLLKDNGLLDQDFDIDNINFNDEDESHDDTLFDKRERKVFQKIKLREYCVECENEELEEPEEKAHFKDNDDLRRVKITALDIDWLFFEDNFVKTLDILATTQNDEILISK